MIRTNNKIFGEKNAENTCITFNVMTNNKIVVTDSNGNLSILEPKDANGNITSGIYFVDNYGQAKFFPTAGSNKLLGTDSNGNLCWINI